MIDKCKCVSLCWNFKFLEKKHDLASYLQEVWVRSRVVPLLALKCSAHLIDFRLQQWAHIDRVGGCSRRGERGLGCWQGIYLSWKHHVQQHRKGKKQKWGDNFFCMEEHCNENLHWITWSHIWGYFEERGKFYFLSVGSRSASACRLISSVLWDIKNDFNLVHS